MSIRTWQAGRLTPRATRLYVSFAFRAAVELAWDMKASKYASIRRVGAYTLDATTYVLRAVNGGYRV